MHNRVIIITGASSGIGAACARRLHPSSRLVLVARRADRLQALADDIQADGGEALVCAEDLSDPQAGPRIVEAAMERFGSIDAVVNNAGIFTPVLCGDLDAELMDRMYALNVRAPMLLTAAALPALLEGGGWVVTVSSIAGSQAFPTCGPYGATKAAVELWSRSLREEHRGQGLRVGVVAPGAIDTDAWGDAPLPIPREAMCRAEDVADAVAFLVDQGPKSVIDHLTITPA